MAALAISLLGTAAIIVITATMATVTMATTAGTMATTAGTMGITADTMGITVIMVVTTGTMAAITVTTNDEKPAVIAGRLYLPQLIDSVEQPLRCCAESPTGAFRLDRNLHNFPVHRSAERLACAGVLLSADESGGSRPRQRPAWHLVSGPFAPRFRGLRAGCSCSSVG